MCYHEHLSYELHYTLVKDFVDLNGVSSQESVVGNPTGVWAPDVNQNAIPQTGSIPSGSSNVGIAPHGSDILATIDWNEANYICGQHSGNFAVSLAPKSSADIQQGHLT